MTVASFPFAKLILQEYHLSLILNAPAMSPYFPALSTVFFPNAEGNCIVTANFYSDH